MNPPEDGQTAVRILVVGCWIFSAMVGDYVLCLFSGKRERAKVERGRRITRRIMGELAEAVGAYYGYCNDEYTLINTDIRKEEILQKCYDGVSSAAIAEEYGCCQGNVYVDIRENEKGLAVIFFDVDGKGG